MSPFFPEHTYLLMDVPLLPLLQPVESNVIWRFAVNLFFYVHPLFTGDRVDRRLTLESNELSLSTSRRESLLASMQQHPYRHQFKQYTRKTSAVSEPTPKMQYNTTNSIGNRASRSEKFRPSPGIISPPSSLG